MSNRERSIRVLVAKPGLDGHDRGAKIVVRVLRDAGMEVIYTGLRQTIDQIVAAARDEDVDVVGLSILSGSHLEITERLMKKLKEERLDDKMVVVGGTIPTRKDSEKLKSMGVAAVFPPETNTDTIVEFLRSSYKRRDN
ncbi:MAG: cobalamin B12-binding domain-containing protein [Chloroflexi bacterium]|nr:cobalamin B12-binding domain-containing protein [Chloroflexota bacterium]